MCPHFLNSYGMKLLLEVEINNNIVEELSLLQTVKVLVGDRDAPCGWGRRVCQQSEMHEYCHIHIYLSSNAHFVYSNICRPTIFIWL